MAESIAEGAREVPDAEVKILQVAETLPMEILEKMGAIEAKKAFSHIPIATLDDLADADAIIAGCGTRYGNMTAQMKAFWDMTGSLWLKGSLIGKLASAFTSTATQHGGQEMTIFSFFTTFLHHGMIIAGIPYSEQRQMIISEVTGGSPYGATSITGGDGSRMPSEDELAIARFQGKHIAELAAKLVR
jgi:NAD(P)H dehydrogenase (quinone)